MLVTPPRAQALLPRLIREGPNGVFTVKTTSPVNTGAKRARKEAFNNSDLCVPYLLTKALY